MLRQDFTTSVGHVIIFKKNQLTSTDVLRQALATSIGHVAGQDKKILNFSCFSRILLPENFSGEIQ
jgi:hypothetical protein